MTLPAKIRTYSISGCNRITYVSLIGTVGAALLGAKNHWVSGGLTVVGSCDGTTGAMDAVDRWSTAANVATKGAGAGNAQSWMVLRLANGGHILVTLQGSTDDVVRISISPGGLFVAAGTPNQQPTATDERVISSAVSMIENTTSGDRLWSAWVSSDSNCIRFAIARAGTFTGLIWGVEDLDSSVIAPTVFSPNMWGFSYVISNMSAANISNANGTSRGGVARVTVASVGVNIDCGGGSESALAVTSATTTFGNIQCELQGGTGYAFMPTSVWSATTGGRGKLGNRKDWWLARNVSGAAGGDTYGTLTWIQIGDCAWPWDGTTTPVMT